MTNEESSVLILMTAYNGERFLRAQMDSILSQTAWSPAPSDNDQANCHRTLEYSQICETVQSSIFTDGSNNA